MMTVDLTLPYRGKELLRQLSEKSLSYQEFMKETSYWLLDTISELKYKIPPVVPSELQEYYSMKRSKPDSKVSREFWDSQAVSNYMYQKMKIDGDNTSNLFWLNQMKDYIPNEDFASHAKIDSVLKTHLMRCI